MSDLSDKHCSMVQKDGETRMTTGDMIRELRRLEEAHKADFVGTGETNWASMCHDVANRLEELLKTQEPVEPKKNDVEMCGLRTWDWACPVCNTVLAYRDNYCSGCGRAVKWE